MNTSKKVILFLLLTTILSPCAWGEQEITVAYYDNPPKIYRNNSGEPAGLFYDILEKVATREGWKLRFVFGSWEECLEGVSSGRIDLVPDIGYSEKRTKEFQFSHETIFVNWGGLFFKKESPVKALQELKDRKIAVVSGCIHTEGAKGIKALLAEKKINAKLVTVDSYLKALQITADGITDVAAVNQLVGTQYKDRLGLHSSSTVFNPIELKFATSLTNPRATEILAAIDTEIRLLKQTTANGSGNSFQEIITEHLNSWIPPFPQESTILFTDEEKQFIASHPKLLVAVDPQLAPIEFIENNGEFKGISVDLLKLLSEKTGLQFSPVHTRSWNESMQLLETKEVDLFSFITPTPNRRRSLYFTKAYQQFPAVIFARSDQHYIANISQLRKKRICTIRGYATTELLKKEGVLQNSIPVDNIEEALLTLARGDADVYIGFILPTTYAMKKLGISNIKIIGETPMNTEFSMGVRKDLKPLLSILNKSLLSITDEEWNSMYQKWNTVTIERGYDYRVLWRVIAFSSTIMLLFVLWVLSLRREIKRRKRVEEELKEQTDFKNSLVQMIVHDMRSPLQVITSYIDLLKMGDDKRSDTHAPNIAAISHTTHSLMKLVNDIIDTQKIEEVGLVLSKEEVDLAHILEETFTKMSVLRQDVKCSLLIPDSLRKAHCDRSVIARVVQNLLGNSLKYTESLVALSVVEEQSALRVEVIDDGPGIPEEFHAHIFEKFGRVHNQKQSSYSTGLGLTFCKLAIEEHGGSIGIESNSGQGSCFWFTLPTGIHN